AGATGENRVSKSPVDARQGGGAAGEDHVPKATLNKRLGINNYAAGLRPPREREKKCENTSGESFHRRSALLRYITPEGAETLPRFQAATSSARGREPGPSSWAPERGWWPARGPALRIRRPD